jgi:hypothetical protein
MVSDGGDSQTRLTAAMPMTNEAKGSWFFGVVFAIFVLSVFVFGPESLPGYKQQILAYICASLAGFFALFFTGTLLLNSELPIPGKWVISGGAGFALFLVVLFWWRSPAAPIAAELIKPNITTAVTGNPSGPATPGTSSSSSGQTHPALLPPLDIPPIVQGGAPIGIKFQNKYLKNNVECVAETVKVSAEEWQERNSSGSPPSCDDGAVIFKYTERESGDPQYILLYDEGRNLVARIPNIPVGQTGPSDWRQLPSQTWNVGRSLTRVN